MRTWSPGGDYESTGTTERMTLEDWWCPSEERWCWCPGPCPDGREHGPKRVTVVQGDVYVSPSTGQRIVHHSEDSGSTNT